MRDHVLRPVRRRYQPARHNQMRSTAYESRPPLAASRMPFASTVANMRVPFPPTSCLSTELKKRPEPAQGDP